MRREWLVPLAMILANAISLLISLVTPYTLVPAEYAMFSLIWASGQFATGLAFEWLRLATLRYSAPGVAGAPERRRVLVGGYVAVTAGLLVAILVSWPVLAGGAWAVFMASALFAIGQGSFDGKQAFNRAARENEAFAIGWIVRAILSLAVVLAVSRLSGSGWWTALALGGSFVVALALGSLAQRSRGGVALRPFAFHWGEALRLGRYGLLAAASGIVANAVPTVVRWALVGHYGAQGAAGGLLAADLSQKALAVTGLAVNVVAMQNSFSAVDSGDTTAITRANRRQIAWAFAAVVPVGLGVWLLGDEVASVLMKPAYRAAFGSAIGPCALAAALIAVRMFAVDPLFYAFERAGLTVLGAGMSLGICVLGLWLPAARGLDPLTVFWASAAAGLAVSTAFALGVLRIRLPWSQLARIAVAGAAMVAADRLLRMAAPGLNGIVGLAAAGLVLGLAYAGVAFALDVVELRSGIVAWRRRRREPQPG